MTQQRATEFETLVRDMRAEQQTYFQTRTGRLREAKHREAQVDQYLRERADGQQGLPMDPASDAARVKDLERLVGDAVAAAGLADADDPTGTLVPRICAHRDAVTLALEHLVDQLAQDERPSHAPVIAVLRAALGITQPEALPMGGLVEELFSKIHIVKNWPPPDAPEGAVAVAYNPTTCERVWIVAGKAGK